MVCFKVPCFATITPRFVALEPGRCEVRIADRRRVHIHLGMIHAITLCNRAELSAGVMTEATIPPGMRWIPRGISVEYLKKAVGTLHAGAMRDAAAILAAEGYAWLVTVEVSDVEGHLVFRARITMWLSPSARR